MMGHIETERCTEHLIEKLSKNFDVSVGCSKLCDVEIITSQSPPDDPFWSLTSNGLIRNLNDVASHLAAEIPRRSSLSGTDDPPWRLHWRLVFNLRLVLKAGIIGDLRKYSVAIWRWEFRFRHLWAYLCRP
jgi:hypothetical protein